MGAEVQVQSNLFLPFGKVRMGLKVRMGYPSARWGLMAVYGVITDLAFSLIS